jgi:hypothetical protein
MAAGLGFIEFTTGDVLTAAAANGYLASQVVMVFADSAARTTAITSPQEGMISYLKDTNATQYYSGSAWVSIGGGSSPLTTKGDLYTYSTTDARLAVGTNGHVLTADSVEATGLKWVAPAGGAFVGCAAFRSSGTQSIPTGTITALTLPSEEYDSDAFHDTSTNTSRFTIPSGKGGKYLVNAFVQGALNLGALQQLVFLVNGSVYASNGYNGGVFADQRYTADWVAGYSSVISLVATDYLEVALFHLAAGAVNAQNVRVSITYLGA